MNNQSEVFRTRLAFRLLEGVRIFQPRDVDQPIRTISYLLPSDITTGDRTCDQFVFYFTQK